MSASRRSRLPAWLLAVHPTVAVEVAARRVTAVAVSRTAAGAWVTAHATEPLPAGAVVANVNAPNLVDRQAVQGAVQRALEAVGRPKQVGVVVPDTAAKVSLVRFDTVPPRAADLGAMIRGQVMRAVPFAIEHAQVSWTPSGAGGSEFVVVAMRRDIVEEYESVCAACGAHAGLVDLATFNLVNLVLLGEPGGVPPEGDWLLVNLTPGYSALAIVRGEGLVFYRNRLADAEGHLADLVHQTAMYYEDRLGGGGFSRVVVGGDGGTLEPEVGALRETLEGRLRRPVETLDLTRTAGLADRIGVAPQVQAALAAPVGLVLREG
jgi:type IV pilus assembly protein PilM